MRRRGTTSTSSPSARRRSGSRRSSPASTPTSSSAATRTCSSSAAIAGKRVVNSGSVGMPYEDEPGAYWTLDLEHRAHGRTTARDSVGASSRDEVARAVHRPWPLTSCRSAASGGRTGSTARSSSRARATAPDAFAVGAVVYVDGEPLKIVVLEARLAEPARDPARAARRPRRRARRPARVAAAARGGRVLRVPARRPRRRGGGRPGARARPGRARLPCERRPRARLGPVAAARRGLRAEGGPRGRPNRGRAGLRRLPHENRRLHSRPARLRLAHRAAAARRPCSARARAAPLQLPRHDAAARGQVDDEPYGGGAGMVLRVDVVAAALEAVYGDAPPSARDRAVAAGAPADAGDRRGARGGGRADASLGALRGLRRADRRSTSRPTRSRSARTCSRTATCRRWCCSTRSRGGCPARSRRARASSRASRRSSAAGSSTRTTRGRRSSAAGSVPDVLLSGDHAKIESLAAGAACDERPARPPLPGPAARCARRARLGLHDRAARS